MEVDEISKQQRAIALYEEGAAKEANGSLRDAISKYAHALRVHADVEKLYRKKLQEEYQLELQQRELSQSIQSLTINSDGEDVASEDVEVVEMEPCWLLDILSDDILIEIITILIHVSPHSHVSLSTTCQRLSKLSFVSSAYKSLCNIIYPHQVYSDSTIELNNITSNQLEMVKNWDFNWELMLSDRPFIKYHGVYISRVSYISEGSNAFSFYNPVKLVTYFRYWRFYPDGEVYKLTTTDEPNVIVSDFHRENISDPKFAHATLSKFNIDIDGHIWAFRETDSYQFVEQLQIVNLGYRKFHRLNWINSSIVNEDGDKSYFNLTKEKPFNFSSVLSYKVNYGHLLTENV